MAYVLRVAGVAALGGLLFGYDTAVIAGAIGFLQERFQLDAAGKGWAASCTLLGCMCGAALAGTLSDHLGRKRVLLLAAVLFAISALGAAIPRTLTEFVIARVLGGFGIGAASLVSPLYIAEVSPARVRGRLVSVNQMAIMSGMVVVYFVNAWIAGWGDAAWNVASGWRWMFAAGLLPALLFFGLLFTVPESPRWLTKQGRGGEAIAVLTRVGGAVHAEVEMAQIQEAIAHEDASLAQLLQPGVRLALVIAIVLAILQQVTGINAVLYYAPEIFKSTGLAATRAMNDAVLIPAVMLVFTPLATWLVDRLGRRPLLLIGSAGMAVSLVLLGRAFALHQFQGAGMLLYILAYVASFSVAMGPVVWVVLSEVFPTRIRGRAMSIATVCLWAACYAVSQAFPIMVATLKEAVTFWIYAALCAVALAFVACFVPETKGKTLEEIEQSWGVGRS
jgi:sugar porter (SP) family MFS transporter